MPWAALLAVAAGGAAAAAFAPDPPDYPDPVDPGKSSLDFIKAMSDPALQQKLYQAEATYRPKYTQLGLQDSYNTLFGFSGQPAATGGTGAGAGGTTAGGWTQDEMAAFEGQMGAYQNAYEADVAMYGPNSERAMMWQEKIAELQDQMNAPYAGTGAVGGGSNPTAATPGMLEQLAMATPIISGIQAEAATAQRTADIADVEALGARATEALRAADPEMQALIEQQKGATSAAYGREAPTTLDEQARLSGLEQGMYARQDPILAQADQIMGRSAQYDQGLSAQQERQAAQQAREAAAARGVEFGNAAIASEILNREEFLRQNRAEARTMRGEAQGLRGEALLYDQMAMGLRGEQAGLRAEDETMRARAFQESQQAGGNLFNMLGKTSADPFQAILGRPSGATTMAQNQQLMGNQYAQGTMGPQLFDPNAGINLGLMNQANYTNYLANTYASKSSMYGGIMGGMLSGMGSAAGGMCWVAREVYGGDDRWRLFRLWLLTDAPEWFANLYMKHGEAFAEWVKNKPMLKKVIRKWMDSRIDKLEMEAKQWQSLVQA